MEYCGCGDLAQKVERYKRRRQYIEEEVIWRYIIQCLKALEYLHEKSICHRDIKVANCFLAEDGSVKIGDMNVSKRLKKGQLQTQIGTPYYMSPEIWNNRPYDSSSDVWSLGCMIYELCALRPPFMGDSFPSLKRAVIAGKYPALPKKYSESLQRVIAMMLRLNTKERPSAAHLLKSSEVSIKLHLDEASALPMRNNVFNAPSMMETIKVPQNLQKLQSALPKPCYPDVRPNSPSAWVISEQQNNPDVKKDSENIPPADPNIKVKPPVPVGKPPKALAPLPIPPAALPVEQDDIHARIRAYRAAHLPPKVVASKDLPAPIPPAAYLGYQGRQAHPKLVAGVPSKLQHHRIW
jgi:NIMA (never in mitosis gene a)-related kinase